MHKHSNVLFCFVLSCNIHKSPKSESAHTLWPLGCKSIGRSKGRKRDGRRKRKEKKHEDCKSIMFRLLLQTDSITKRKWIY